MLWLKRTLAALACAAVASLALLSMPDGVQTTVSWFVVHARRLNKQPLQQPVKKGIERRELYDEPCCSKLLRDPSSANNTLFESETALSGELKALIYQKLREGATRGEILDYMAERYGEAVRYQPDFNATTFLLWAAPWIAVVIGAFVFWRSMRRKTKPAART
mgnify:CR=1 FL=1